MTDAKAQALLAIRANKDMVRDNTIFREKVRSEKRHAFLNEQYDFNPKNLVQVSDKLTNRKTSLA